MRKKQDKKEDYDQYKNRRFEKRKAREKAIEENPQILEIEQK